MTEACAVAGPIIAAYGWPAVFYIFGILGLTWAVVWPFCRPNKVDPTMAAEQVRSMLLASTLSPAAERLLPSACCSCR